MTSILLLAIIAAAGPGFLYRRFRQWWDREPASIRRVERRPGETAAIALIPITGALWLFAAIRAWCPARTPDVGELLRQPNSYLIESLPLVAFWFTLVGLFACAIALVMAYFVSVYCSNVPTDANRSVWYQVIHRETPDPKRRWSRPQRGAWKYRVRLVLIDGSQLQGTLQNHNPSHNESQDRDIALMDVVYTSNSDPELDLSDGTTIISAAQIRFWNIIHEQRPAD